MTNERIHAILEWGLLGIMALCAIIGAIYESTRVYFLFGLFTLGSLAIVGRYVQAVNIMLKYKKIVIASIAPSMWLAKVIASKSINRLFSIEPQNISNTSLFIAAIIFCLIIIIIIIISIIPIMVIIKDTISSLIKGKISDEEISKNSNDLFLTVPMVLIATSLINQNYDEHIKYILISDAYYYSDCAILKDDSSTLFIRKNDRECYKISRDNHSYNIFTWNPVFTVIESKKPS